MDVGLVALVKVVPRQQLAQELVEGGVNRCHSQQVAAIISIRVDPLTYMAVHHAVMVDPDGLQLQQRSRDAHVQREDATRHMRTYVQVDVGGGREDLRPEVLDLLPADVRWHRQQARVLIDQLARRPR